MSIRELTHIGMTKSPPTGKKLKTNIPDQSLPEGRGGQVGSDASRETAPRTDARTRHQRSRGRACGGSSGNDGEDCGGGSEGRGNHLARSFKMKEKC